MAENFKVFREHRRSETNMNVPPVDDNLQIRTLRSRNIPYDIRHKHIDKLEEDRNLISLLVQTVSKQTVK